MPTPIESLLQGAYDLHVHVAPDVVPRAQDWLEVGEAARAEDWAEVNRLLDEIVVPLYAIRNRRPGYKCSMIKTAMEICGLPGGRVRAPLIEMTPEDRADLDTLLEKTGLKRGASVRA